MKKLAIIISLIIALTFLFTACDGESLYYGENAPEKHNSAENTLSSEEGGWTENCETAELNGSTLYYSAQKYATEAFLQEMRTSDPMDKGIEEPEYPYSVTREIRTQEDFEKCFDSFPEPVDFENEMLLVYSFTSVYMASPYELVNIVFTGSLLTVDVNLLSVLYTGSTTAPAQRLFAVKTFRIFPDKIEFNFGERYTDMHELEEKLSDEVGKSEFPKPFVYSKKGNVYMQENRFVRLHTWFFTSGVPNNAIVFDYEGENAEFFCKASAGNIGTGQGERAPETTAIPGQTIYFVPVQNGDGLRSSDYPVFIDITLKVNGKIKGYAVIRVYETVYSPLNLEAYVLKSVVFAAGSNVSQETVEEMMAIDKYGCDPYYPAGNSTDTN